MFLIKRHDRLVPSELMTPLERGGKVVPVEEGVTRIGAPKGGRRSIYVDLVAQVGDTEVNCGQKVYAQEYRADADVWATTRIKYSDRGVQVPLRERW